MRLRQLDRDGAAYSSAASETPESMYGVPKEETKGSHTGNLPTSRADMVHSAFPEKTTSSVFSVTKGSLPLSAYSLHGCQQAQRTPVAGSRPYWRARTTFQVVNLVACPRIIRLASKTKKRTERKWTLSSSDSRSASLCLGIRDGFLKVWL